MVRFFLDPIFVATDGSQLPKYFAYGDPNRLVRVNTQTRYYGEEPLMLVAADVDDTQSALIASQPDVTKFADDLDQQLGADLDTMQTALETLKLPAQMLTATTTHRQVLRGISGVFQIAQCMAGKGFNIFAGGVTLSTTLGSLPTAARQALTNCATTLGFDTTGITLSSTIRQVLTAIVQQATPSAMMGVQF